MWRPPHARSATTLSMIQRVEHQTDADKMSARNYMIWMDTHLVVYMDTSPQIMRT